MPSKTPVIISTDPGVDDVIGILCALASPELEVLAIIVSYGNTDLPSCWKNIFKIYGVLGLHFEKYPEDRARFPNFAPSRKTILASGADKPLKGDIHLAQYFHGRDGLADISSRHPEFEFTDMKSHPQLEIATKSGLEVALDIIKAEPPRSITYITLGPLTDLALMMRKDAVTVQQRLGRVCCMGGALDVPGNTSPVAEFNFFADPYAVHEVLTPDDPDKGFPLDRFIMLPLDITTPHELPFPLYKSRVDNTLESTESPSVPDNKPILRHFTSSFFERVREVMRSFGKDAMELHDPVAIWCAIANPLIEQPQAPGPILQPGWKAVRRRFQVEREGEITRGMLVVDRRLDDDAYAPGDNRAYVQDQLDKGNVKHGPFEAAVIPAPIGIDEPMENKGGLGVFTIVQTPGPDVILNLLLKRIWGVESEGSRSEL